MLRETAAGVGCLVLGVAFHSSAAEPRTLPIPKELQAGVAESERLGKLLFEADSASARATDAMFASGIAQADQNVRGWVTVQTEGGGWDTSFVEGDGSSHSVAHLVHSRAGKPTVESLPSPRPATVAEEAMFRARQTALAQAGPPCGTGLNPVVLPASVIGRPGWLVYVLQGTQRKGERIVAGHRCFIVSPDGGRVVEEKPLSKGCIALKDSDIPEGAVGVGSYVSSLVSEYPLESHVFTSLDSGKPLWVTTARGVWEVDGGRIRAVETPPKGGPECRGKASGLSPGGQQRCCEQGVAGLCAALAKAYATGQGVPKDVARAAEFETLGKLASQKPPPPCPDCDHCEGPQKDNQACQRACEGNPKDAEACLILAKDLLQGHEAEKALRVALTGCDHGSGQSCTLAVASASTGGLKMDAGQRLKLLKRGCELDDAPACGWVGLLYVSGQDGVTKDEALGARLLGKSCAMGYTSGCSTLGQAYENGAGVKHDEVRAGELYQKACDGGPLRRPYPKACFTLGDLYDKGKWLPGDKARAKVLYDKACQGNVAEACQRLEKMQ